MELGFLLDDCLQVDESTVRVNEDGSTTLTPMIIIAIVSGLANLGVE